MDHQFVCSQEDAADTHRKAMADDLRSLRKLAVQLKRMAPTADDHVLRAILGKRESLLNSIRLNLSAASRVEAPAPASVAVAERSAETRSFAQVVEEINAMDQESARVLRERAEQAAADIHKIRAGRQWREDYQT